MTLPTSARVALWMIIWLAVIDGGVSLAFKPATNALAASGLQRYFEYGRSVEGKLRIAVAGKPSDTPILSAGWIDDKTLSQVPTTAPPGSDLSVTVYGQSFAFNASREAAHIDGRIALRAIGGPGAPPNHSYGAYKADAPNRKTDVVVFGILSSAVPLMGSMSGLVWMFESPAPFTFSRYHLTDGQLTEESPSIRSEAAFRDAFSRRSPEWQQFKAQLRSSDRGYDRFIFDETFADKSSAVRLMRRGWVAHSQAYEDGVYARATGFNPDSEEIRVLKAMLLEMARQSRERNEHLIVLLLHARGYGAQLNAVLEDTLKTLGIDHISTDTLFSANDPSNFMPDGHYTERANRLVARALLKKLRG
jgi:hypothetical protein